MGFVPSFAGYSLKLKTCACAQHDVVVFMYVMNVATEFAIARMEGWENHKKS